MKTGWRGDLFANANRTGAKGAVIGWIMNPGFAVATLMRRSGRGHARGGAIGRLVSILCWRRIVKGYGCYIAPSARIGERIRLPHPVGIVIGEGTRIGDDVTIYQNVTFGRRNALSEAYPTVEDGVTIYAGATLIGDIRIGAGATIGAHALVIADVPPGAVVTAAPARARGIA